MSDTPETEAAQFYSGPYNGFVLADFARRLERERDAARREVERARQEAIEECAVICERFIGSVCEDEGNGGVSHDYACKELAKRIRDRGRGF